MSKTNPVKSVRQKTVRIREDLHAKLEEKAKREQTTIIELLERIIINDLAVEKMDIVDLKVEEVLIERLRRFEERIAKMWGKQGMDVAMTLMAVLTILSRDINRTVEKDKQVDVDQLLRLVRPMAAKHFSSAKADG